MRTQERTEVIGSDPGPLSRSKVKRFRKEIYSFYTLNEREFPWRNTTDPYHILVSEIMLQQTQTERVVAKYLAFLERFPTLESLAVSSFREVLELWSGLGYNRRAKALKDCAEIIVERFHGRVPEDPEELLTLPGIGPYTAGAVSTFAYGHPNVFIETNIRRVFIHYFFPEREGVKDREIVQLVSETMDREDPRSWYYALMDYGAQLKRAGRGERNPNRRSAHYQKQSPFEGSDRQIRGGILRVLLQEDGLKEEELVRRLGNVGMQKRIDDGDHVQGSDGEERIRFILDQLEREGMVKENRGRYTIDDER